MRNDELKTACLQFIIPHSSFIVSLLVFVQLPQRVEHEVGVAERLDCDGEFFGALLEVERAGGYFDDEAEGHRALRLAALRADDAPLVEEHAPMPLGALD